MTLEEQEHNHTVAISNEPRQSEVQELREEVAKLTEQVIALTTADSRRTQRCFSCNRQGHTQRECPDLRRQAPSMLAVWPAGSLRTGLQAAGKRSGGVCKGQQLPLQPAVDPNCITVAAIRTEAATVKGVFGELETAMMLDSGSSISLIQKDVLSHVSGVTRV